MTSKLVWVAALFTLVSCTKQAVDNSPLNYVNPLIGTAPAATISAINHGHGTENNAQVIPSVTVPLGMTNWTPQTRATETKCVAPYYYNDSTINGFRGTHWLSGSCVQDYGSMSIMPLSGKLKCGTLERASAFTHNEEESTPYNYRVTLSDYNIQVEMTATRRCGMFRFKYVNEGEAHIVVNPNSDEGEGFTQILPRQNEIIGYNPVHRIYQGWGEKAGFSGYFVARFSHGFTNYGTYQDEDVFEHVTRISDLKNLGGFASFYVNKNEVIEVCIGTSFTSIEQARKNLDAEIGAKTFNEIKSDLKNTWESILNKVQVEGENEDDKTKFYTALYHAFLQPRTFNDVDGSYVSFSGGDKILNSGDRNYYVDFSMWDTYRASHPLFNLLMPNENTDMMYSLIDKAKQGGWLPIFPCWSSYTSAMIGDHAITTLADACIKNVIELNDEAYSYLLKNAFETPEDFAEYKNGKGRRALESYKKYGFVPLEDEVKESFHQQEQVSRTLEYAFDDFALSQVALKRGDNTNHELLTQRAFNYKNVYSAADSCVRGRYIDGRFTDEFNKLTRMPYITEGTPWQYTWYVPHDINGLMELMGGQEGFNNNLDNFHAAKQYWHGNEPGHQIPFLYNFSGEPWKTQKLVTEIMKQEYDSSVGGLSGNDDAGQMSAWYVFAAMGFYPVCPSVPEYVISGPHFDKITINQDNGNTLKIYAPGASSGKNYIQAYSINDKNVANNFLSHSDIVNGGILKFQMSDTPNKNWGREKNARPFSLSK
ncbi:GH92 family glycosyl hydrolase [uncultured Draconibacterium sp.]|uniref:GH92 family glycosyl hydrolase n=1 Tax=uncultured Draconibacterium sp. TaxID=1573823 RepID=UPI0032173544